MNETHSKQMEDKLMECQALYAQMVPQMSTSAEILVTAHTLYKLQRLLQTVMKDDERFRDAGNMVDILEKAATLTMKMSGMILAPLLFKTGDELGELTKEVSEYKTDEPEEEDE